MSDRFTLSFKKSDHYLTPRAVLDPGEAFGPITFDPFAGEVAELAPNNWRPHQGDSLRADWILESARGAGVMADTPTHPVVFANPAYGRAWLRKSVEAINAQGAKLRDAGHHLIALLPASTGARWFSSEIFQGACTAGDFWQGRISFLNPGTGKPDKAGSGRFWSFVGYWGNDPGRFFDCFRGTGELCRLNVPAAT